MKRSLTTLVATSAAVGLMACGALPASAAAKPKPGPWQSYNDTITLPAGSACKDKVTVHTVGRARTTEIQKDRHYFDEFDNRSRSTYTNTKTKQHWSRTDGGDADRRISKDGKTVTIHATGENWNQGKGIRGITWSRGPVTITVTNAQSATGYVIHQDFGRNTQVIQVCNRIGSSAVPGKNVP